MFFNYNTSEYLQLLKSENYYLNYDLRHNCHLLGNANALTKMGLSNTTSYKQGTGQQTGWMDFLCDLDYEMYKH